MVAYMLSCMGRERVLRETLSDLAASDWDVAPTIEVDDCACHSRLLRQRMLARRILERAVREGSEFVLLLEDDLKFNRNLRANLSRWPPLRAAHCGQHFFASLFNPGVSFRRLMPTIACAEAEPSTVYGSQALIMSYTTARYFVNCWGVDSSAHLDLRLRQLAARVCPILYHVPSLVQHRRETSTWGGPSICALDFDRSWRVA
jgi:hypothetical protein